MLKILAPDAMLTQHVSVCTAVLKERKMLDLSARLAAHVAEAQFGKLPSGTAHATKRAILDGLGVMLAASGSSTDVLPFIELARAYAGAPQATLLGFHERVSLPMAAFANGSMAHALDFEDAFDPAPTHPNASLLPAAFAVAQSRAPIAGDDFIAAVATGCDLTCRIALSLRQPLEAGGWYPPPILGAFGATAAVASLMRLCQSQIVDAFSLLLCQNTCPGEIKYSADTVIRAVREAFPAQAAVLSALLAERGTRGFDHPFEGRAGFYQLFAAGKYNSADLFDELGRHYWIDQLSFKKWPCCRGTHAYVEAAQLLRAQQAFRIEQVASLRVEGDEILRMLCEPSAQKRAPRTVIDAKFSLPFTLAAALAHEEVTLGSFTEDSLRDPRLLALAQKVEFRAAAHGGPNAAAAGDLTIVMDDGRELHHRVARALGDAQRPLEDSVLRDKFIDCAARAALPLARVAAERLADRILALESEPDVGALLA
jgi:2-methylcitrate dehydratase PrpD